MHHLNIIHSVRCLIEEKKCTINLMFKLHYLESSVEEIIYKRVLHIKIGIILFHLVNENYIVTYFDLKKTSTHLHQWPKMQKKIRITIIASCFNELLKSTFTRSDSVPPNIDELPIPTAQLSQIFIDGADIYVVLATTPRLRDTTRLVQSFWKHVQLSYVNKLLHFSANASPHVACQTNGK